MAISNTATRYGSVTKTFHWLTALLILTLIGLGLYAEDLPIDTDAELARKAFVFSLHKTMGVLVFFVALARILWALTQSRPGLLNADKRAESFLAELVHWVLYGAIVIVPLAGWISHAAAAGFAPIWWPFGQSLPLVPKSTAVEHFFGTVHVITGKVLIGAVILHIAGALKHHFIDRDATLRRMLPGTGDAPQPPAQSHSAAPLATAAGVWVLAIALSALLAGGEEPAAAAEAPALEAVASDWTVQNGTISLKVIQFGNEVEGSFADWTSAITFDETINTGEAGSVTTTISIPSLTLGSVTKQALGADFLAANDYPTAVFDAVITHVSDGYEANGTLRIKENAVPVTLPFSLSIDGDTAEMRGDLTLDRRDFGVGDNVKDAKSLDFDVAVSIRLEAVRAAE